jgi:polysaccharide biosynthesis transport protein
MEERFNREINKVLTALRDEAESAQMNEAALRQQLEDVRREMFQLDQAEASIGQVAQRLKANQDLYQNLLKRYTEAVALRENQQPDARIISPAQVPLSPSHPNLPQIIALSFVGSMSLVVCLLVIAERLREKRDTGEDLERHVGLQVIGVIPDLPRLRRLASTPATICSASHCPNWGVPPGASMESGLPPRVMSAQDIPGEAAAADASNRQSG